MRVDWNKKGWKGKKEGMVRGRTNLGMKSRDKVVIALFKCSIPLDTSQFGRNGKLGEWVVFDGTHSITFHSIPYIFYKIKQWNVESSHTILFHTITLHQFKHNLKWLLSFRLYISENNYLARELQKPN